MSFTPLYQFPGIPISWAKIPAASFLESIETLWIFEGVIECLCFTEENRDNIPVLIPNKHFYKSEWKAMVKRFSEEIEDLPVALRHCPRKNFTVFGHMMLYGRNGVGPSFGDDGIWTEEEANALDEWAEGLGTIDVFGIEPPYQKVSIQWPTKESRDSWSNRMGHTTRLSDSLEVLKALR
jgi:hypothetical protein